LNVQFSRAAWEDWGRTIAEEERRVERASQSTYGYHDAEANRQSGLIAFRPSRSELRTDDEERIWAMDGVRRKPRPKPLYPV
jgi:hypothetical protein